MTASVSAIAAALGLAVQNGVVTPEGPPMRYLPYLSDTFSPPVVLVSIETVKYHEAMEYGNVPHDFTLELILSRSSDRAALLEMESYMSVAGASSVCLAVEKDVTLGGVVQSAIVTDSGPPISLKFGTSDAVYLRIPFKCSVIA
jgi:hypothetical protein